MREPFHFPLVRICVVAAAVLLLSACAGDNGPDKDALPPDQPVNALYTKGTDALDQGKYEDAAKQFAEVERQHPYSKWATHAQIMEAYAYYQNLEYDKAIATLDDFIQLHPGNTDTPYAYYLRAECNYERIADVTRDQTATREALRQFHTVIDRYPATDYAKDAALKISLINDHLAGAEMDIGRWYEGKHLYIAAIGRFHDVVKKYQTTSHVPEALERLVECYVALGIMDEAKKDAAVLGYNYPGSDWYRSAYDLLTSKGAAPDIKPKT
ncbi:MAG: outer membrane protein assembly factor BamD [Alphaproteobacteria bacterium]|nr:outer membrane protein assembly factor BamD [Alphaproteobacteria bacterium]